MAAAMAAADGQGPRKAPVAVVRAEGHVDVSGIEACDWLVASAGPRTKSAVVDLSGATYVEQAAARILAARRKILKARGGDLAVAAGRREVRDALRLAAGMDLPVFVTMDEAMGWVSGEGMVVAGSSSAAVVKRR
jgi:anti-anti-sigma factor